MVRTLGSPGTDPLYWLTSRLARFFTPSKTAIDTAGIEMILNDVAPEDVPAATGGGNLTPSVPRSVSGEGGPSSGVIDAEWIAPEFNADGITSYVFWITEDGTNYISRTVIGTKEITQASLTGLTGGTQYTISMYAINAAGNGSISDTFTATATS